ncbi:MAG: hypothetical protein LBS25_01425, partial [Candidatus Symbiothrix sp.]|nr:hypothetical protein [Candidatus Symbiothrix sp.]
MLPLANKRFIIKKGRKILLITLASPFILAGLVYLLLWLPPVQQKIKNIALSEVIKRTHNRIEIRELSFRPFNYIRLSGIYVEDLRGDTLVYVENLSARFDLWRLKDKQLIINSIQLNDFVAKVAGDSANADFNFQFLIDAFASDTPDTTSFVMQWQISDIQLKNGRLHYDMLDKPVSEDGLLDVNHIKINNLALKTELDNAGDIWNIRLKQFSCSEQKGLQIEQINAIFDTNGKLSISKLQADYKNRISLKINAYMDNYMQWQTSPLYVDLTEVRADTLLPTSTRLSGRLQGDLSDLSADIQAESDCGNLHLKGRGGYNFTNETAHFDASVRASDFDLKALLNDAVFGSTSFQLHAKGSVSAGKPNLTAEAHIDRFDYQNYVYQQVDAQAVYRGETIELHLNSQDENIPLVLDLTANTSKKTPSVQLNVDLQGVCIEALHLLSDTHNLLIVGKMHINVSGFNP